MTFVLDLLTLLSSSFIAIYDFLFEDIIAFLSLYSSPFSEFLLNLAEFVGITEMLSNISFGGFFLGGGVLTILVVNIIYWFIP